MPNLNERKLDRSWVEDARVRFDALNNAHVMQTRGLLGRMIPDAALHSRLTNTLSLLEHMGSHKIMVTQNSMRIEQATLRHVAEEVHHALFMRRQAEKMAGRPLAYTAADTIASTAARMYFQRLEARVLRRLSEQESSAATYLYVSMIIEFRALWFYALYDQALRTAGHAMSLKRILGEEAHHLDEMAERLEAAGELDDARVGEFMAVEHRLYENLLTAIRRDLQARLI